MSSHRKEAMICADPRVRYPRRDCQVRPIKCKSSKGQEYDYRSPYQRDGSCLSNGPLVRSGMQGRSHSLSLIGLCTGSSLGGIKFVDVVDQLVGHGVLGIQLLVDDLLLEQPIVVRLIV